MCNKNLWLIIVCFSYVYVTNAFAEKMVFPELIPVPDGFQPEGVAVGKGHTAYVGSLITGGIYQLDLRSGEGRHLVEGEAGNSAVGLAYDERSDYLYVAGGLTGTISVYDAADGSEIASYHIGEEGGFINDGIVTAEAAYFTDSFVPVIYRIPLTANGRLPQVSEITTLPLGGDFTSVAGQFNANGIEASANGKQLYVVNLFTGALYQVDPDSAVATEIQVTGGNLESADGILFTKNALYVVQNIYNQLARVELSSDGLTGTITDIITHPQFRIPTTIAAFGNALYAINARFDIAPPPLPGNPPADPNTTFNLVRVELNK